MRDTSTGDGGVAFTGMNQTIVYLKGFERDIYDVLDKQVREIGRRTVSTVMRSSRSAPPSIFTFAVNG